MGGADLDALVAVAPGALTDQELRDALRVVDRLRARLDGVAAGLAGAFDARCVWAADGARSAGSWLAARCDVTRGQANGVVRLARALRDMPVVEAASVEGRVGREKVRALAWARQEGLEGVFAACEAELVRNVEGTTVAGAWRYLRRWVADARARLGVNDPDGPEPTAGVGRSTFRLGTGLEGRWFGTLDLEAVDGEVLANAVEHQLQALWEAGVFGAHDGLSVPERRARALVEVITRGTRGGEEEGTARPLVLALVDAATLTGIDPDGGPGVGAPGGPVEDPFGLGASLGGAEVARIAELSRSGPVPTATIRRLACEGSVCPVVVGRGGAPFSMGRTVRLFTRRQRRALRVRDGGCAFAGCAVGAEDCIAHHLVPWEQGGPTDLDNAALVCRYHHRLLHEGGFGLERDDHGRFTTTRPDGTPVTPGRTDPPLLHRRRPPPGHHPGPAPDPEVVFLTRTTRRRIDALIAEAQAARASAASGSRRG